MGDIAGFQGIAPYLKDPLVLIGFVLFLAFSFSRYLIKRGIIKPLPGALGYRILRLILLYGFILGLFVIVLGFALKRQELINQQQAVASFERVLRDALSTKSSLSEEEKNKIIEQALEAYRSGALSEEQIVDAVERIKYSATGNVNYPPAIRRAINQLNSSSSIEPRTASPLPPTKMEAGGSTPDATPRVEAVLDAEPQYPVRPTQDAQAYRPPTDEVKNTVVVVQPSGAAPQTCTIRIDEPKNDSLIRISPKEPKLLWHFRPDGHMVRSRSMVRSNTSVPDSCVKGSAKLPPNCHLWVLVRNRKYGSGYIWQPRGEATVNPAGIWEICVVLGRAEEVGDFDIAAVVVDEQTNRELIRQYKDKAIIKLPNLVNGCSLESVRVNKRSAS